MERAKTGLAARLWRDERGQDLVEYILLVTLIALAVMAGVEAFGTGVDQRLQEAGEELENVTG